MSRNRDNEGAAASILRAVLDGTHEQRQRDAMAAMWPEETRAKRVEEGRRYIEEQAAQAMARQDALRQIEGG